MYAIVIRLKTSLFFFHRPSRLFAVNSRRFHSSLLSEWLKSPFPGPRSIMSLLTLSNHRCFDRLRGLFSFMLIINTVIVKHLSALHTWPAHSNLTPLIHLTIFPFLHIWFSCSFFYRSQPCVGCISVHKFSLTIFSWKYLIYILYSSPAVVAQERRTYVTTGMRYVMYRFTLVLF